VRGEAVAQNEAACPNLRGGVRWQPPAYNPDTGNSYAGGSAGCFILEVIATEPIGPEGGFRVDQGGGLYGFNGHFNATGEFSSGPTPSSRVSPSPPAGSSSPRRSTAS
jgi:hypothetical protein